MGLFDKKYCDICGEKIGLLGNRKLSDGNLCKDCARKLSPRFTERKVSTVAEIREQLKYREENKAQLGSFTVSNTYGTGSEKLYLDAGAERFVVSNVAPDKGNPDIVTLDMVTGCELDVHESRTEVKYRSGDGRTCSYSPAQYTREFDFNLIISVNHPYFDQIKFQLNGNSVNLEPQFTVVNDPNLLRALNPNSKEKPALVSPRVSPRPAADPACLPEYIHYSELAKEVKTRLLRQAPAEEIPAEAAAPVPAEPAPAAKVICPYCGSETADAKFCEFCGAPLK